MNNRANHYHLLFFVCHVSLTFLIFPEFIYMTGKTPWAPVVTMILFVLPMFWLYLSGLRAFPGQNLIDIFQAKGKWFARLLLFPYAVYCMIACAVLLRLHAEMLTITMFKQTPLWALTVLMIFIPLYMALQGLPTILRSTVLLTLLCLPMLGATVIQAFQNMDYRYAFPLGDLSFSYLGNAYFYTDMFAFSPFLFLGMVNRDPTVLQGKSTIKLYYVAFGLIAALSLLSVYIPIMTFGAEMADQLQFSMLIAMDAIDLEWFAFDRITVFYLCAVLGFALIFLALLIWVTQQLLTELFLPKVKSRWVIYGICAILFAATLIVPSIDYLYKVLVYDTPLRLYCMLFLPVVLKLLSLKKGRSA
ncbi:spore germination protein [Tumebacillus sp. BK434]|uniref:GerAB/ArcD/ProY family transporter n=1 Tax=Tumebacillus sp. BK434 TaxID=2512169 RepID=UPI00104C6F5A|nr:GerAB/ArcD/ProY family transporter [Tumebacillus sp. BK434]TCP55869.1 spore germination protein [Tumebacillus sp. BK434]